MSKILGLLWQNIRLMQTLFLCPLLDCDVDLPPVSFFDISILPLKFLLVLCLYNICSSSLAT